MVNFLRVVLGWVGLELSRKGSLKKLLTNIDDLEAQIAFEQYRNNRLGIMFHHFPLVASVHFGLGYRSTSQLNQDLLALGVSGLKQGGFFVEFGATDGVTLSNSYLLEKEFGWAGILAEPGLIWQSGLRENRSAIISAEAVWSKTGEKISFLETKEAELSTFESFRSIDGHERSGKEYEVITISLTDLLLRNKAPEFIDLLSIDTEGSEFEILSAFDFSKFRFGVICVEHNFTVAREKIFDLLDSHGYKRILVEISEFDDWYVPKSYAFPAKS